MKAPLLVLLTLVLGAGLVYFLLAGSGGRGARSAATPSSSPTPPQEAGPEPRPAEPSTRTAPDAAGAGRQASKGGVAPPARSIFEGMVIGDGSPVPGAHLELVVHEVVRASSATDARGRFRLECDPLQSAGQLRVEARGFVTLERNLPGRPAGGTVMLGNLRLHRGQRIEGRVLDAQGGGIAEAVIRVEPYQADSDLLVARGRSGREGRFQVADCPPGTVLVSASAKGFGEVAVTHNPGQPLEIQLEPGAELRVRLLTPGGAPVAGASVLIQPRDGSRSVKREALSDAEGRVTFKELAQREWNVRVTHPEYRTNSRGMVLATGSEERIECIPWPAIEGLVRAPGGGPLPAGTRVQALPASAPSDRVTAFEGGQEIGSDGVYRIGGLRGGDWRVRVTAPGYAPALSGPVRLGIEGTGNAGTVELTSGGTLALLLRCGSTPVAEAGLEIFATEPSPAQLWAFAADSPGATRAARSDPHGLAKFDNQSSGTFWVAIYAEGSPPTKSGPHVVAEGPPGPPVEVQLVAGGRFQGRVLEAGRPVPHAQVRIVDRSGKLGFPLTLVSSEEGRYTSGWLPAGRFLLEAFPPEDPRASSGREEVELAAGEQKSVDIEL